jgi:SAM-dependent methyltransferase
MGAVQPQQDEWRAQWSMFEDQELFLFQDWIHPLTLDDFRGRRVLEAGCGGGQHTAFIAASAREVVAVDLNTTAIARERNRGAGNVTFVEADIATMDLGRRFDLVLSIGVVHHTDDPDRTVANLARHVVPGGRLVLWVYSREGNALIAHVVEPLRRALLRRLDRRALGRLAWATCLAMYPLVHTIYRLPLPWLPYWEYFRNFRRLSFERNTLNVFDKLNAPQVQLITRERIERWFGASTFVHHEIRPYLGVSWRAMGVVR